MSQRANDSLDRFNEVNDTDAPFLMDSESPLAVSESVAEDIDMSPGLFTDSELDPFF